MIKLPSCLFAASGCQLARRFFNYLMPRRSVNPADFWISFPLFFSPIYQKTIEAALLYGPSREPSGVPSPLNWELQQVGGPPSPLAAPVRIGRPSLRHQVLNIFAWAELRRCFVTFGETESSGFSFRPLPCLHVYQSGFFNVKCFVISVIYSESNAWKVEMEREGWREEKKRKWGR